jgi:hypothetical protein
LVLWSLIRPVLQSAFPRDTIRKKGKVTEREKERKKLVEIITIK